MKVEDQKNFDFNLDLRMPLHVENTGSTKYIILILVDSNDSSNF